jgi:prepilin-type N-terminal cleavage/methylation domain-containing protein/prepilin-type processing-associated H-X9-DG protein
LGKDKKSRRSLLTAKPVTENMQPKRIGFTLIELMIVIGILALLLAVLLPVFAHVQEKGRQVLCLSNERQLGLAFLMYTQDNDENVTAGGDAWAGELYPYVTTTGIFRCPSDGTVAQPPYYPVSYGINANLQCYTANTSTGKLLQTPHSIADLSGKTILLFEVVHSTAEITTPNEGWVSGSAAPHATSATGNGFTLAVVGFFMPTGPRFDIDEDVRYATGVMVGNTSFTAFYEGVGRHQGGANFVFPDAHVQWLPPQRVSTGGDAPSPTSAPHYGIGSQSAAGSEDSAYAATFSTK